MPTFNHYDIIVIGAGLAGALIARNLAEGGMQVVVLEATTSPGGTAKSRYILSLLGTPEPYSILESRWGRATALQIWDLTYENLHLLNQCLEKTGQVAEHSGSIRPTAPGDDIHLWQDSVTLLQDQGYEIEFEIANASQYEALMITFDDIVFDGKNLIKELLNHSNIIVEYGIEVNAVKPRKAGDLAIWGYRRYLWGDSVVLANGIHAIRFQENLNKIIRPRNTHTIDANNVPSLKHPMILHRGKVNIIPAGEIWHMTGWGTEEQEVVNSIITTAQDICPDAHAKVRYTSWLAQSIDNIPIIGALPNQSNVYTINGLGAFGGSWVFVAAQQLADLILHNERPRFLDITRLYAF
jgi:glycine/D-amino acid oxidase-like deaminating enzyme